MKIKYTPLVTLLILFSTGLIAQEIKTETDLSKAIKNNREWPSYRGFYASGFMDNTNLPDSFNTETGYNIKWEMEIPGLGLSCPSIWGERIFITTAISDNDKEGFRTGMYGDIAPVNDTSIHTWILFCIDKNSGNILWEEKLHEGVPAVKRHPKSTHANTTVATNGKHVVTFLGTEGLYCHDKDGNLLWKRDFGLIMSAWNLVPSAEWEFSSSPILFEDKVIVQADALNTAFIAVLDIETGKTIWRQDRNEISGWCTPNIYFDDEKPRVVVNGYKHRGAYDLNTGEEVWKMSGGGDIPVPTPIIWKDLIFFNSAHGKYAPLMAVRNDAKGELKYPDKDEEAGPAFAWFKERNASYMSSVLVYNDLLYRLRWNGNLTCYDARTGEEIYSETVYPYSFIASPVASDGRLYLVSEEGDVFIIKAGKEYELLHRIPLGEVSLVTPGIVDGLIVFRTAGKLIGVGE